MSCAVKYVMETQPTWQRQIPNIVTENYKFVLMVKQGACAHSQPLQCALTAPLAQTCLASFLNGTARGA